MSPPHVHTHGLDRQTASLHTIEGQNGHNKQSDYIQYIIELMVGVTSESRLRQTDLVPSYNRRPKWTHHNLDYIQYIIDGRSNVGVETKTDRQTDRQCPFIQSKGQNGHNKQLDYIQYIIELMGGFFWEGEVLIKEGPS
jgi:hypothetical protein